MHIIVGVSGTPLHEITASLVQAPLQLCGRLLYLQLLSASAASLWNKLQERGQSVEGAMCSNIHYALKEKGGVGGTFTMHVISLLHLCT